MRYRWILAALFSVPVAALTGCAFSPQAVVIKPVVKAPVTSLGRDSPVGLQIIDERPKKTLGTRGVRGVGAELTIEGELTEIVRNAISDGLTKQAFKPSPATEIHDLLGEHTSGAVELLAIRALR